MLANLIHAQTNHLLRLDVMPHLSPQTHRRLFYTVVIIGFVLVAFFSLLKFDMTHFNLVLGQKMVILSSNIIQRLAVIFQNRPKIRQKNNISVVLRYFGLGLAILIVFAVFWACFGKSRSSSVLYPIRWSHQENDSNMQFCDKFLVEMTFGVKNLSKTRKITFFVFRGYP